MKSLAQLLKAARYVEEAKKQLLLIRALAFGERSFILIYATLLWIDQKHAFLSVPGVVGLLLGMMFLGPVFGITIYALSGILFKMLPHRFELITWIASFFLLGLMLPVTKTMYTLYVESYDSLLKSALGAMHL